MCNAQKMNMKKKMKKAMKKRSRLTLPLTINRVLTLKPGAHETILVVRFLSTDQIFMCTASIFTRFQSAD